LLCDRLVADFQELDKQMTQEAKRMQGQNKGAAALCGGGEKRSLRFNLNSTITWP